MTQYESKSFSVGPSTVDCGGGPNVLVAVTVLLPRRVVDEVELEGVERGMTVSDVLGERVELVAVLRESGLLREVG